MSISDSASFPASSKQASSSTDSTAESGRRPADRNLALELVRATEAAAIRSSSWVGKGRKNDADAAAVDAMREFLGTVHLDGTVVIGEGEKDEAPMLFNGERVGDGLGAVVDIAVDPIDGTSLTAAGRAGALSVLAVSDRGTMLDPSSVFYMDKIACGAAGRGVVSLEQDIEDNIREFARAAKKEIRNIRVAVLDRPRHAELIERIRSTGAGTFLLLDGDVAGGVQAALPGNRLDMCVGIGGSPEAIITACAIKALGGVLEGRPAPKDEVERAKAEAAGLDTSRVYSLDELVRGDNAYFVATGITDGELVRGVTRSAGLIRTESMVLRSASGTVRHVTAEHIAERWV